MQERTGAHLEQIEAFAAVAEQGGFAAAARALGRDASVISRRLDALEARLGVRLLSRTTRRVALTETGTSYLRRVQAILAEMSAADVEAAEGSAEPRGLLRLSLQAKFARLWIAPWLPDFLHKHPHVQIELHHGDRLVDLVSEGFDAAIRLGALQDSSLIVRRLVGFETVLCASPTYIAAHGAPEQPQDLQHHACLGLSVPQLWPDWRLRRGDERVSVRVPGLIVSDDSGTLTVAGVNGAGIMAASEWSVGQELASGQLVRVLPEWLYDWTSAVHVVMPPGRFIPAKTRAFIDRLVAEFAPDPPWRRISERGH
ncbi:MAG TPA: LysR family transcriptional regulator [Sphingomonadaceae bacterium]|nr:LysR family transcriptional regulator [Sphingomonadaceae bacterium]